MGNLFLETFSEFESNLKGSQVHYKDGNYIRAAFKLISDKITSHSRKDYLENYATGLECLANLRFEYKIHPESRLFVLEATKLIRSLI